MNPKFARFLANRHEAARVEAGEAAPSTKNTAPSYAGKLENLVDLGTKWQARCPACAEQGRDRTGEHLVIYPEHAAGSGHPYGCLLYPESTADLGQREEHLAKIWSAIGDEIGGLAKPYESSQAIKEGRIRARQQCAALWAQKKVEYAMSLEDFSATGGDLPSAPSEHFAKWWNIVWQPGDFVWVGGRYDQPQEFRQHLFKYEMGWERAWEVVSKWDLDHCKLYAFQNSSQSRAKKEMREGGWRGFVVEIDGVPVEHQVALIRYVQAELNLRLLYVLHTGGQGVHGIFDPAPLIADKVRADSVAALLSGFGADPASMGAGNSRTPGATRRPDENKPGGRIQKLVWLPR